MRSCVDISPPLKSRAQSNKNSIVLPPSPSKHARLSAENGTLSIVVPPEVMAQVSESIVRLNGEASRGPVKVDDEDIQQWEKVVCCVAVTADVYQASTDGRVPKDARLIVFAKPQHDSRAEGGVSLCADTVAAFEKPFSNLIHLEIR